MNVDAMLADAIRDTTHTFRPGESREHCDECGRQRWAHSDDGHRAPPEHKYSLADTKYRPGPHPYWSRPGSFNKKPPIVHQPYPGTNPEQRGSELHSVP